MDRDFWEEVERSRRMTPEQRFRSTLDLIDLVQSSAWRAFGEISPTRIRRRCLPSFGIA